MATVNPKVKTGEQLKAMQLTAQHAQAAALRASQIHGWGSAKHQAAEVAYKTASQRYQRAKAQAKKNPNMFGSEAVAKARQVTRSRTVQEKGTNERGRIIGAGPKGWLKVQWDNRAKPTLIKRSELKLARGLKSLKNPIAVMRCTSCGQVYGQTTECPMCHAGIGRSRNPKTKEARFVIEITRRNGEREQFLIHTAKEAQMVAASWFSRGVAVKIKDQKLGTVKDYGKRNPSRARVIAATKGALKGAQMSQTSSASTLTQHKRQKELKARLTRAQTPTVKPKGKLPNPRAKGSRDAFGVWHAENPEFLTNRYRVVGTQRKTKFYLKPDGLATGFQDKAAEFIGPDSADRAARKENNNGVWGFKWKVERFTKSVKNPSVSELSEKFQGEADGSLEELYAASSAPKNLARAGKLVFLKIAGKTIRVPGAVVAIAPNEKLWITGDHAPLFQTKAKRGEGLDYGEVTHICYETAKAHIGGGKTYEYVHEFGEDGGKRPHLVIDSDGMPILRGGDYVIRAEGIVN